MAGAGVEVGKISIKVTPDTDGFRRQLASELEAIEKSLSVHVPVELDLDTDGIREKVRAATAGLDEKINVKLDVDRSAFDRLQELGNGRRNNFGGGGLPLGSFADSAALVAAAAALAAPALALVTGALAALPAVLAGVLTPIGVIALGLDGIKKAAEVLTEPLANLKKSISGVFETRLTPVFTQLADAMPKLEGPLKSVAEGISDVAASFANTISTGSGLARLQGTISNIADAISASAPGISSLTNGLLGLADTVSKKFPNVAKWFNDAADAFSRWVDKVSADGSLDTAMSNFGDTIKSVLDLVGELAKQGFDFLKDPEFGKSMVNFVDSLKNLASDVLPSLKQFFMDLSGAITTAADSINLIKTFDPGTGKAEVGDGIKNDLLAPFTSENAPWRGMVDGLKTAWDATLSWMQTTWGQFTGFFSQQGSIIAQAWSQDWEIVKSAASTAASAIVGFFSGIPGQLGSAWSSLGSIASGAWQSVVAAVQSALQQAVAAVVSGAAQVIAAVVNMGQQVVAACANFGSLLIGAGKALIQGLINGIKAMVGSAISAAVSAAQSVANAVKGALGIHSPSTVFHDIGVNTMEGLENGLDEQSKSVLDKAKLISQQLADAMDSGTVGAGLPDDLKRSLDELDLVSKGLKVGVDQTQDKDKKKSLRDQMSQVQSIRDQLNLQKEQLGFSDKYGDNLSDQDKTMSDTLNKVVSMGEGFASSNIKQFASDLGISGNGAIPQLAEQGLNFLTSGLSNLIGGKGFMGDTYNVSSADDAIALKNNNMNKKSLQFRQR